MAFESKKSRIILFFAIGLGLSLAMTLLKAIAAWLCHTYLYSVPWAGGFLRSIELAELSNWVAFAILGVGIGAATLLLPARWDHRAKLAFLALMSPFVFSGSYLMQQHLWIKQVAERADMPYREARDLTNNYLKREAGNSGFFGFYPYSTQLAELPTQRDTLESSGGLNPNEALTEELAGYDDPRADFAAYVFERVGWLVRFVYIAIAFFTGLIYYFKGHVWAETNRRRDDGNTPPRKQPKPSLKRSSVQMPPVKTPPLKKPSTQTPPVKSPSAQTPSVQTPPVQTPPDPPAEPLSDQPNINQKAP